MRTTLLSLALFLVPPAAATSEHLVLVEPGDAASYLPAARAMAELRHAELIEIDSRDREALASLLRDHFPRSVVFVLPPSSIDVDLCRDILEISATLDDDPFQDFEHSFVTGRDGQAASAFVAAIVAARVRKPGRTAGLLGSWEGAVAPAPADLTVARRLALELDQRYVLVGDTEEKRTAQARAALAAFETKDLLILFSHGYPDRMVACFEGSDLHPWGVRFPGATVVNCCCYGGAPGRWVEATGSGATDRGEVPRDRSVALGMLDTGLACYFAGIDPWHGWLANQVIVHLVDQGVTAGATSKHMADRLALEFLPGRIDFAPALEQRFEGEGTGNRRRNGASMILYGDPDHAPFAKGASRLFHGRIETEGEDLRITMGIKPLLDGLPSSDFLLAVCALTDYYSVKTSDILHELGTEVYRVFDVPGGMTAAPRLRVVSARAGDTDIPTSEPQLVLEDWHGEKRLHVRVPIPLRPMGTQEAMQICTRGIEIVLAPVTESER